MEQIQFIPFDKLVESKTNPRQTFDEASLKELAASIKEKGMIDPIKVRPLGDKFEIIDGARRFRAAKMIDKYGVQPDTPPSAISAFIILMSDEEVIQAQMIGFLQRKDLGPMEEAEGFAKLQKQSKLDIPSIAAKTGKSATYVQQRLKFLDLIPPARKAFSENKFTISHAILIARLQPKDQNRVLAFALKTWQGFRGEHEYRNGINPNPELEDMPEYNDVEAQTVCSVKDLADFIQLRILLDLKEAAFDKKDDKLVPKAGSCIMCPKRSGFNKELFNDITQVDICTDPQCFADKQEAHLLQLKAGFKKDKKKFIEVTEDRRKPEGHSGAITERSFKKVAENSCKFSRIGIYIDGSNKGDTVTICAAKKLCKKHWPGYKSNRMSSNDDGDSSSEPRGAALSPKEQIERLQKKIAAVADSMTQEILLDVIPDHMTNELSHDDLVEIFEAYRWYGTDPATKKLRLKGKPNNWKTKELQKAVKLAAFYSSTEKGNMSDDDIRAMAKRLKIDIAAIEKQARIDTEKECKDDMNLIEKLKAELAPKKQEPKCRILWMHGE